MIRKEYLTLLHKQERSYILPGPKDKEVFSRRSIIFKGQVRVDADITGSSSTLYLSLSPYTKYT